MLKEEFEIWPVDLLSDITFVIISMYFTNLGYLEDRLSHFTKLLKGDIEKSNRMIVELNTAVVIPEIDNQDLLDLIDLKVE